LTLVRTRKFATEARDLHLRMRPLLVLHARLHQPQVREFTITSEGITLKDQLPTDPASQG
jgi:hypothetical protein